MSKGPGLFSDIGKNAKDLLTKDYCSDQKFTISSITASGLGKVDTFPFMFVWYNQLPAWPHLDGSKKSGLSSGEISAALKHEKTTIDLKVDTDSNIFTTVTVLDIVPSTKTIASIKLPDFNSGKLELQYFHHHAALRTVVGLNASPALDVSATFGTKTFALGAETEFNSTTGNFTKYNAGISITRPDSSFSIILADKGELFKAAYVRDLDLLHRTSAVVELSRHLRTKENTLTIGAWHGIDRSTVVKARLNNHGNLAALLQHELKPRSVVTLSGEFNTKSLERSPKFGLAVTLKP